MIPGQVHGSPAPGERIADRYDLQSLLGEGGMGVVFAARDVRLERDVAIKFLKPEDTESSEARARFIREAKSAGSLRNESAVAIFDTGLHPPDTPFIVMERLAGEDLSSLLQERTRLPVDEAVDIVLQACGVLSEAHALGIIHRDIKPSNLFVTSRSDGSRLIKVLDFGLAKAMKDTQLTRSLISFGSPRYMSPEQVRSVRHVDARTDVWSTAVVLYELLAGKPPFNGYNVPAIAAAIVSDEPKPLAELVAEVPHALSDVLMRALAKRPDDRISSIAELERALRPFGSPDGSRRAYKLLPLLHPQFRRRIRLRGTTRRRSKEH